MALRLRLFQRTFEQRAADAAVAERRLDRQRSQQQRGGVADKYRQLPDRADQQRADPRRERQIEPVIDMLAQTICAQHKAAGPEGPFMQPLDRQRVACSFRRYGERKVAHVSARDSI